MIEVIVVDKVQAAGEHRDVLLLPSESAYYAGMCPGCVGSRSFCQAVFASVTSSSKFVTHVAFFRYAV